MLEFYFDDFESITSGNGYNGKAILEFENNRYELVFFYGRAIMPFKVELRKKYKIILDGKENLINYRFITNTKEFEETYSYDGPLGFNYTKEYTEFYIWAPTAYSIAVNLLDKGIFYTNYKERGVYYIKIDGDLEGTSYNFLVEHSNGIFECLDPYGKSSAKDSKFNYIIDFNKVNKLEKANKIAKINEAIIYECNIRDMTSDKDIEFKNKGLYRRFIEEGVKTKDGEIVGYDYIKSLGITHIQLMPVFDFGSIPEDINSRKYNWGYDPIQYNVLEGRFSENPNDPYTRINEFIDLVNKFHKDNIGVVMDVVYNHVYNDIKFSFDTLVPYYYFRYKDGIKSNASFCGNEVASERYMVRRYIVDSLKYLVNTFNLDGFRFDLMGIHDIETMKLIKEELTKLNHNILLYGEGWDLPVAISKDDCFIQRNNGAIKEIGFFNDNFRNSVKAICAGIENYINKDLISLLIKSEEYSIPEQSIQYVSCHDDYTLYDHLYYDFELDDVIERMKLAYIFVLLSKGVPFIHSGCEGARTKFGVKNSYNSSEELNQIRWNEIYKNAGLIDFVKELISFRKREKIYNYLDKEIEIEVEDNCILYKLSNKVEIYINCKAEDIDLRFNKNEVILSFDGKRSNENIKNIKLPKYSYIAIKK